MRPQQSGGADAHCAGEDGTMAGKRVWTMRGAAAALLVCALLVSFTATVAAATSARASTRRIVRVGITNTDTLTGSGTDNREVAFEKDYLQAVAEYAGWDYVYVQVPWDECIRRLKNGEIDVLLDVSKTEERTAWFDYSSEPMGTELCYLFGRGDTTLRYNDFENFNGMRVGYERGSTIIDSLTQYGREMGFTFEAVPFDSGAQMFKALDAGEIDTAAQTSFYDTPEGHVILAKCCPSPVYIATRKTDPKLVGELNEAMAQLFGYNPSFNAELYRYHFESTFSKTLGYTQQELDYLAKKPVVDVYYETSWQPFEYEKDGQADGITPDVIRAIGEDTGIQFHFVLTSSTQDVYAGVDRDTEDAVMAVSYDYLWANDHDLFVTQPYVGGSAMRVTKRPGAEVKSVAVVKDGYLANEIKNAYPELTQIPYFTFEECMQAVKKGTADCVFLNYYQASYYRAAREYADFNYQPDENIVQNISLGVTRQSDPALFGVLSKSLQRLSAGKLQGILNEEFNWTQPLSFNLLMWRYPAKMALLLGLAGVLFGLLVVLLVTSYARKRQNEQLAAAKLEAEVANDAKSDFLSRMSHDMRTPLNGIIGMTYLTSKLELPDEARENLRNIDTSSHFLLSLINDVLDMSKVESGKVELHPEPYSPSEFRRYINAVILPLCESKNQKFSAEIINPEGCVPVMDKLRVNQIVFNLLSNAVKYTPEGGDIRYVGSSRTLSDNRLAMQIRVTDNGIGMSEKFQKLLFDPFTQEGRNDNSEIRGSGLGLAITKCIVELMGGTISVQSSPGVGSTFTVELELDYVRAEDEENALPKPAAASEEQLAGRHILLCEDNPLNQEIARALLEEKGMLVEIADDGQAGLNAFVRAPDGYYSAVLMDIRMPIMDGYEATRRIRALERPDAKTVPIIAMTADAFADDVRKCRDAGMNAHIAKPVDPAGLYETLTGFITR